LFALQRSPKEVVASSLTDEVAALTDEQLIQLLAERGLEFVEVKVHEQQGVVARWTSLLDQAAASAPSKVSTERPFARFSIAPASDPYCVVRRNGAEGRVPVLPGHCLRVEPISEPKGSHRIEHEPADLTGTGKAGALRLVERATRQVVAQLPSAEPLGEVSGYGPLKSLKPKPGDEPLNPDCRLPHSLLAGMLVSADSSWRKKDSRFINPEKVGRDDVFERASRLQVGELPVIQLEGPDQRGYTAKEEWLNFLPWVRDDEWVQAVERARNSKGLGPYGSQLIDLNRRQLIYLKAERKYPWDVRAIPHGFLVWEFKDWVPGERRTLMHLDRCGRFAWAVALQLPVGTPKESKVVLVAASVEGAELFLAERPRSTPSVAGPPLEGRVWRVPLGRFPPFPQAPHAETCDPSQEDRTVLP
ncbi:MAG: hypothetical protein ACK5O3_18045, partial [Burkholderiales bacterium]